MSRKQQCKAMEVREVNGYKIVRLSKDNAAIKVECYELTRAQRNKLRVVRMPGETAQPKPLSA